jgi:predicted integral membrane protein DUF2269
VNSLLHFGHMLGFVLWLGGGLSSMVFGIRGRSEDRYIQGAVARLQATLHRRLIIPGVILVVLSGIWLSVPAAKTSEPSAWLMVMQAGGMIGALLMLFVASPTVHRLARIEPVGETSAVFDALRKRLAIAGTIAGILALLSLVAGVLHKY